VRAFAVPLLQDRRQRPFFYDLHTRLRHVPYARSPVILDGPLGRYPVALLPTQYQSHRPDVYADACPLTCTLPRLHICANTHTRAVCRCLCLSL
jgi:hypothetical protein